MSLKRDSINISFSLEGIDKDTLPSLCRVGWGVCESTDTDLAKNGDVTVTLTGTDTIATLVTAILAAADADSGVV